MASKDFKFETQFQYDLSQLETNEDNGEVNGPAFIDNENFERLKKGENFIEELKVKRTSFELMKIKREEETERLIEEEQKGSDQ